MPPLTIRPFTESDWPALWPVIREILAAGETYPYPRETAENEAHALWIERSDQVFVAERGGMMVGTYYIRPNQPGLGDHICNSGFMVSSDARGGGIGRAMGEHALVAAAERGYRAMQFNLVLVSNPASIRIWQQLGFETVGRIPQAFRHSSLGLVDALIMYRRLQPSP